MKNVLGNSWPGMIRLCRAEPDELAGWLERGSGRLPLCLVCWCWAAGSTASRWASGGIR